MIRRLLWLVLAAWLVWMVRAAWSSYRRAPEAPRSRAHMVRDRICNTFLPDDRALILSDGGARHYFCSEKCRDEFLERRRAAS